MNPPIIPPVPPPYTSVPDYVWNRRYAGHGISSKRAARPEDSAQTITHHDAESALQAAKQSCRKHPDRWFGRGTGIKGGVEFWVHEGSKILERHTIG